MKSAIVLLLCLASIATAQIDLSELYEPYKPIEARCACALPVGAVLRVTWTVPESVQSREHPAGDSALYLWAKPGKHTLAMLQIVDYPEQMEILVPTSATDPTPIRKVITVFTRPSEFNRYERTFEVTGKKIDDDEDDDEDEEDDVVGEAYYLVVIEESEKRTPAQAGLWDKIRTNPPGSLKKVYRWDKDATGDTPGTWTQRAVGKKLPYYFIVAKDSKILKEGELPATYEAVEALVK